MTAEYVRLLHAPTPSPVPQTREEQIAHCVIVAVREQKSGNVEALASELKISVEHTSALIKQTRNALGNGLTKDRLLACVATEFKILCTAPAQNTPSLSAQAPFIARKIVEFQQTGHGKDYAQIATFLHISENSVKILLTNARAGMGQGLSKDALINSVAHFFDSQKSNMH